MLYAELQEAERTERGLELASAAAAANESGGEGGSSAAAAKEGDGAVKEGDEASHWGATAAGRRKPRFYGVRNAVCVQPFHTQMYAFPLEMVRRIAASWAAASRRAVTLATAGRPSFRFRAKRPHDRFRIGYVSAGFGDHPTGRAVARLLHVHDRRRFEVFAYSLSPPDNSAVWKATSRAADHLKDLSDVTDVAEIASIIHTDGIHILIDLDGYCQGARPEIFAMAPAPLAISWAPGYNATTGASPDHVHYLVGDPVATPLKSAPFYSEKLLLLPHGTSRAMASHRAVTDADGASPAVLDIPAARVHGEAQIDAGDRPARSEFGLPEQKFVFACFNSVGKMDPVVFRSWCRVVRRVPNALLWLLEFPPAVRSPLQMHLARPPPRALSFGRRLPRVAPRITHAPSSSHSPPPHLGITAGEEAPQRFCDGRRPQTAQPRLLARCAAARAPAPYRSRGPRAGHADVKRLRLCRRLPLGCDARADAAWPAYVLTHRGVDAPRGGAGGVHYALA